MADLGLRRGPAWLALAMGWLALGFGPFAIAASASPSTATVARQTTTVIHKPTHVPPRRRPPSRPRAPANVTAAARPARQPAPATTQPRRPTTTRPPHVQAPIPPRLAHPIPQVAHPVHRLAVATKGGPWSPLKKGLFAGLFAVLIVGAMCWVWLIERDIGSAYAPDAAPERAEVGS